MSTVAETFNKQLGQPGKWVDTRSDRGDIFYPEEAPSAYTAAAPQRRLPPVVGLTGWKHTGKSTIAALLTKEHGYLRLGFADPLKAAVLALGDSLSNRAFDPGLKDTAHFDLHGATPRELLLAFGVAVRRHSPGLLIRRMQGKLELCRGHVPVVVDDMRLPEEAEVLRPHGPIVLLERAGLPRPLDLDCAVEDIRVDFTLDTTHMDSAYSRLIAFLQEWRGR